MANMDGCIDNVFEWYTGDKTATVTFSQKKWVTKLLKLAKDHSEVEITTQNDDGSIVAHVPTSWFKFSPPRKVEFTEEQKAAAAERMAEARKKKKNADGN